jgi:hypothetical protein
LCSRDFNRREVVSIADDLLVEDLKLKRLRFHKDNRTAPDHGGLVVVVQKTNTLWILPTHFSSEQIACDQFEFYLIPIFDQVLDLANAGQ